MLTNADPRTYDLNIDSSVAVITPVGPSYNGLVEYDDEEPERMIPALAEKWETSSDGRIFTFHMRRGVRWHDGKPFTAADAEYGLKRIMGGTPI